MSSNGTGSPDESGHSSRASATTVLKYEKSSCLFCNEWFDSQTFTEHLIHCGQVLEECPNHCSAFVPRIRMRLHLKECPRGSGKQRLSGSVERLEHQMPDYRLQVIEQEISALRSVLNEEIRQRLHLITDVGNLRKQNQIADEWTQRTEDVIAKLQRSMQEDDGRRNFEIEQCQNDFRYCYDVVQTSKSELQHELDQLQKHINELSLGLTEHQNLLNDNIMKLEETVVEQERTNRGKFTEIEEYLNEISADLKTRPLVTPTPDISSSKQAALDYELKSIKSIVCETEERCDKLEAMLGAMDRNIHLTMQRLADVENHIETQQRVTSLLNTRGHLVWRIKSYTQKLEEAKQYDTILHSAMFSNKPFGYALRLDIHLNGKGTWKGRNMIACLNVIPGEYDPLLEWPCRLQADIIIRDQNKNPDEAQNYVKTIYVRKKSDEYYQTNQYFHIPHKVIASRHYLRNDSIYVEVRVLKLS